MLPDTWFIIGSLMLAYNTWRDLKTREIDSRWNFFAFGATVMLLAYLKTDLLTLFLLLGLALLINLVLRKPTFSEGDHEAVAWVVIGLGATNLVKIPVFLLAMAILTFFGILFVKYGLKLEHQHLPGYLFILTSFLFTAVL